MRELGSVSKIYVGKMCGYPEIVGQLSNAAVLSGMNPNTKVTGVGDGGIGLKEELEVQFPNIQFILDQIHLKDHLFDTAEALGIHKKERVGWVKSRLERISRGESDQVTDEFENEYENKGNNRVKRLIGYLSRFSGCMDYDEFKEKGCPIGSGEVESAHRSIPQKRLKLPGACWHPSSVNPMLALRVLRANDWWNNFWKERTEKLLMA